MKKNIQSTFKKALFCIIATATILIGNEKSFGQTNYYDYSSYQQTTGSAWSLVFINKQLDSVVAVTIVGGVHFVVAQVKNGYWQTVKPYKLNNNYLPYTEALTSDILNNQKFIEPIIPYGQQPIQGNDFYFAPVQGR